MLRSILRSHRDVCQTGRRALRPVLDVLDSRLLLSSTPVPALPSTATQAAAPVIVVTSVADFPTSGMTLRQAVQQANNSTGPHVITFDPSLKGQAIKLNSALTVQGNNLIIKGDPSLAGGTIIDGQNTTQLFQVHNVDFTIDNCQLVNANSDAGSAIQEYNGTLTVRESLIGNCRTQNTIDGGAVAVNNGFGVFDNDTFINNTSMGCGAAVVNHTSTVYYEGCTFVNNFAGLSSGVGGAIFDRGGKEFTIVDNCLFDHNTARDGGAIYNQSYLVVRNSRFTNDLAYRWGGAIETDNFYGTNPSTNIFNSTFSQCHAGGTDNGLQAHGLTFVGFGGDVFTSWNTNVDACDFANSSATGLGGAIAYLPNSLDVAPDNVFESNIPNDLYQKPDLATYFS